MFKKSQQNYSECIQAIRKDNLESIIAQRKLRIQNYYVIMHMITKN